MTTRRQLEANRANAKRSTGPRSISGKSRSCMNALKHGLTASDIVVWDEDPADFDRLRENLEADFKPATTVERELIDQITGLLWRIRRLPRLEADHLRLPQAQEYEIVELMIDQGSLEQFTDPEIKDLKRLLTKASPKLESPTEQPSDTLVKLNEKSESLTKLSRYEANLRHALIKTLGLLHALQNARLSAENEMRTVAASKIG